MKQKYETMKTMHAESAEAWEQIQMQMNANPAPAGTESNKGVSETYPGEEADDADDKPAK